MDAVRALTLATLFAGIAGAYRSVSESALPCGIYRNELNSTMDVDRRPAPLGFTGWYVSAVGDASKKYAMTGGATRSGAVAWSVVWDNHENGDSMSTTAWSGYFDATSGKIHTTWTLATAENTWNRWSVGQDVFTLYERKPCIDVMCFSR